MSSNTPTSAKVLSFEQALARKKASMPSASPPFELEPGAEPTLERFGLPLFADGLCFFPGDLLVYEDTGAVLFPSIRVEQHVRDVFTRWGFELDDFTGSFTDILAAYQVFGLDFNFELKSGPKSTWLCEDNPALKPYIKAVVDNDSAAARKLMSAAGMVEHMQKARALEHEKAAALDKPRKGRSSALENSVVAFLLATPLRAGAPGQTVGDFARQLLATTLNDGVRLASIDQGDEAPERRGATSEDGYDMQRSEAGKQFRALGLELLRECPREREVAILFRAADLARVLNRSAIKDTWRKHLGPFVGFDSDFRLLMDSDLDWWRLGRPDTDWCVAPLALPEEPVMKARSTGIGPPTGKKAKQPAELAIELKPRSVQGIVLFGPSVIKSTDFYALGVAAYMAGLATVATQYKLASFDNLIFKSNKQQYLYEIKRATADERLRQALNQFHQGLRDAAKPPYSTETFNSWFQEAVLPKALECLPPALRKRAVNLR